MKISEKKRIICRHGGAVICPGCGEAIYDDDDLNKVEYVRTRRATYVFFHSSCVDKA